MGLHLMAVTFDLPFLVLVLEVAFALGMVIFVHELGHFAVAKWCGVKIEKFYLGFDIYGLKLARFKSGETEYGIGILPLGGYVKMLGQDDNPSRAAGERERSILRTPEGQPTPVTSSDTLDADGERYQLDPRSYMAKSVPQRMAIISAGVIMNVIFAFVTAMIAYTMGVKDLACGISAVYPGEAAWRANLQPGDEIIEINDSGDRPLRFRDLMNAVALADMSRGIDFKIQREGVDQPFWINVRPDQYAKRLRPTIGIANPVLTTLSDPHPVYEGTPAAHTGAFQPNDRIVAIDGEKIEGFADYKAQLVRHPDARLRMTVERKEGNAANSEEAKAPEQLDIEVAPRPIRSMGLAMKIGKIAAIQSDSPADKAGLRADDLIVSIDGQPPTDPLRLPDELRRRGGETIKIKLVRETRPGETETLEKEVTLREPRWSEESAEPGSPVGVPALGIAFKVSNVIQQIQPGSPAAGVELKFDGKPAKASRLTSGDEIVKADIILPEKSKEKKEDESKAAVIAGSPGPIKFSGDEMNWPFFNSQMQLLPAGTKFRLTLKDGREAMLEAAEATDWFNPNRGFILSMEWTTTKAHSVGEAASLAGRETVDAVTQVYAFLRKIGSQISPYMLGGPKTIAEAAGGAASKGLPELLIFLTMLSANLAVINFLPIPLLDGGHMVFLTLEGIFRRPVSERVIVAFHYLGFLFIISLMVFVLGLDFGLIPRG